jgi:hypothetical protein
MDFTPSLNAKSFFRFTGPPENWLTAIKYMTWGLEEKHLDRWQEIQPGDIFFFHSTGPTTSLFNNAKSGLIGIGIVGPNFSKKDNYLWIHEQKEKLNKWPLLVPFSEIYLFSEIPSLADLIAPSLDNGEIVKQQIDLLLKNSIPLSQVSGFPQMGSFSKVSQDVADKILYDKRPLYLYSSTIETSVTEARQTTLDKISDVSETLRYADTLKVFDSIKTRIVKNSKETYVKDNELLAKAEVAHATVLQQLITMFKSKGFETRSNRFVDLFAYNEDRSFLFEVKSTENNNFRSQARKGIVQLYEYDYFEVSRFVNEHNLHFDENYRVLVPSKVPKDNDYISFINDLNLGVAMVEGSGLKSIGKDFGFTKF